MSVSPQDKPYWVEVAREKERDFVQRVLPTLGFRANLNPAKEQDPYAPDLVVEGHLADLKCQRTPFFQAEERFRIDPRYAVTFNRKDYERYCERYPSLDIYFWVDWHETCREIGGFEYEVERVHGVWRASFPKLRHEIEVGSVLRHEYLKRLLDDRGNVEESFVFDLGQFEWLGSSEATEDSSPWVEVN